MTRLLRLCAAAAFVAALAGCTGGQGPTLPDIEREPGGGGAGLEEQDPGGVAPAPSPGQSPIDEPDDSQPRTEG
ncbi:MAG TPA: hypothetical protein VM324_16345 [Egibacteraceae bacterium]|jgi:predicted small lipoprotein YifL|nr:hypothetical protein [Egibacteraceae bacterium]